MARKTQVDFSLLEGNVSEEMINEVRSTLESYERCGHKIENVQFKEMKIDQCDVHTYTLHLLTTHSCISFNYCAITKNLSTYRMPRCYIDTFLEMEKEVRS